MLTRAAVLRSAPPVRAKMGRNAAQLDQIVELIGEDGSANLARVLSALYPGEQRQRALASLRQLRLEIEEAAEEAAIEFRLSGDMKKRAAVEERTVWFEGEDRLMESAGQWVRPELDFEGPYTPTVAQKLGPIRIYVVYAERDRADATKLLEALEPHFQIADIKPWSRGDILPGENPAEARERERQRCDLTLQFFSPQFQAEALEAEQTARVVRVLLHDLTRTPEDIEVFRYQGKAFEKSKPREFARELFLKIAAVLEQKPRALEEELRAWAQFEGPFVEGPAAPFSFRREVVTEERVSNRCDAITFLDEWLKDAKAPRYCALLGELGMGKTTTAKEFARRLGERRGRDGKTPIGIFLDLRYVGDFATRDPDLDEIVGRILKKSWKGGPWSQPPSVKDIHRLVEQGALVIFDGLDEVLVHLTPNQGQLFTRQLFRMVPPQAKAGRLLVTCRTHYFRTFQEQSAHFTMEDRDSVRADSYVALLLLPFGERQIRTYLENTPGLDADRAYEFIESVHNLPELAERPYTLSVVARQFRRLEEWKAAGRRVTGLTLYRFVVEEWLLRDQGKHQFHPDHKQMLMEHVAAELLRSGGRTWSAGQLEQWLMDFLEANRGIASHYEGVKRDLLKEDLRTATFLVRDEKNDQFRFAHSSLQEYFLACYLRRALEDGDAARWALRGVSEETLDFLGQSLMEQPSDRARKGLAALRDGYVPPASELAFRYFLLAHAAGYPAPPAAGFQLPGADLFGLEVDYKGDGLLDLRNLNLKGARVANTFWRRCRMAGSDFSSADAARSEWHESDLSETMWRYAALEGAMFRRCAAEGADYGDAGTYRTKWLSGGAGKTGVGLDIQLGHSSTLNGCAWSPDGQRVLSASSDGTLKIWDAASGDCLLTLAGHSAAVRGCAWSPDGGRVLSASDDKSLKIWDAGSGKCLLTLAGHSGSVYGCAWSPDGGRVVSASCDNTLKIWDAFSGEYLLTLAGHSNSVLGGAWSPDGGRVLSSSNDLSLKIWDAGSGDCLLTLVGHSEAVRGCAWSPDGHRVLSGSYDETLRIWDSGSGDCLLTLVGHSNAVKGCAWSPDGRRVLSASRDQTLKIWDAGSGECLLTLSEHSSSVNGCAWSPRVGRVLSASDENTLKVWDAASGDCLLTLGGNSSGVNGCGWSPDGGRMLSASVDGSLKMWDAGSGGCLLTLAGHSGWVRSCAWSPDGRRVLSASDDQSLKIWDAGSGECLLTLEGHSGWVRSCAWSPDGRRVLSASDDQSLKIWDAGSGECLLTLAGHFESVRGCAWSPDGGRVLSGYQDGSLRLWDAASGDCLSTLAGHSGPVYGCAWSLDGCRLLSFSYDHGIKIWDAISGYCVLTLADHSGPVYGCAWSPGGGRVLSVSRDGSLKVWDAASGDCLITAHTRVVPRDCCWSPDGARVMAGFADGSVRIFDANTLAETGRRCYHLTSPHFDPTWASYDPVRKTVLDYGQDAWRYVGYVVPDSDGLPRWVSVEETGSVQRDRAGIAENV